MACHQLPRWLRLRNHNILRTFGSYIRDGLIPNMFPEGENAGLYHTADATMWFFHAVLRYGNATNDRETIRGLLPKLIDIVEHHLRGTRFNIHVDPADGLLSQGAEGYQLTWMDAKVDGWVVTPRRGKAVEINALWYNALRVLEQLLREEGEDGNAIRMGELAARACKSFNERFWYEEGQYLYDVVDVNDRRFVPTRSSPFRSTIRSSTRAGGRASSTWSSRSCSRPSGCGLLHAPMPITRPPTTAISARATPRITRARCGAG